MKIKNDLTADGVVSLEGPRSRGRPRSDGSPAQPRKPEGVKIVSGTVEDSGQPDLRTEQILKGVTATWFARVLNMDVNTVKARLKSVTPMGNSYRQAVYDLRTALPHLVDPVTDIETYLRNMDPKLLPTQLTPAFWQAEKARLATMTMAKKLWPTDTVLVGYAQIFRILRDDTKLWLDTLDEATPLSDQQRAVFGQMIDGMLDSIYKSLREHVEENGTHSEIEYLEARLAEVRNGQKALAADMSMDETAEDIFGLI